MRSVRTSLAFLLAAATMPAFAQSTVTLDATSGTNTISTSYSTTGGLTLNMGFFADYLVLAGGGGGGGSGDSSTAYGGGGGGAGGLLSGTTTLSGSSYSVVVGGGGAGGQYSATAANQQGSNGANSVFGAITATGGGGGGSFKVVGNAGGSGGGGGGRGAGTNLRTDGGPGTAGQGSDGGASRDDNSAGRSAGGGGGGAGAIGGTGGTDATTGGNGGAGVASTITGSSVTYAGGGGGGAMDTNSGSPETAGTGGTGGGGGGSTSGGATAGTDGLGGGGGGVGNGGAGGQGGAGLVIVRYQGASLGNIGGTVTTGSGSATGYTLHTFRTTGTTTVARALNLSGVNMNVRLNATLAGTLSGAGGMTYNGPGTLTLTGSNTYTGGTELLSGTLSLGSADAIGPTGTVSFGGGTLRFTAANTTDYSSRFSTAANQAYALDTNGQSVAIASSLTGTGASLTKLGSGTLALAGSNFFAGGTALSGGVLSLGTPDALGSTGAIAFSGGTLQFTAANTTDYSARFSAAAGQAYALDTNGQDVTFATSLSSTGGSLTKAGAGTLTLTGTLNLAGSNPFDTSDDGRTRVAAGTLVLPGGANLNGSHLTVDGTGAGPTATMLIDGGSVGPKGTRDFGGPGLTVGSQGVGVLTINTGELSGDSLTIGDQAGSSGTVTVNGGTTDLSGALYVAAHGVGVLSLNAGQVNSDYLIAVGSGNSAVGTLTMAGGTLTTLGANSLGCYIGNASSGILQMSGGRADFRGLLVGIHQGGVSGTGTVTVTGGTVAVRENLWLGYGIGSAGTLNVLDTGVVTVGSGTGAITLAFTGSDSTGLLNIGTGAAAGTLLAGKVEGARSSATVNFNHTGTTSFLPALTGTMNVNKLGGGTTILSGTNTYTGVTNVAAGRLSVNGVLGTTPVAVLAAAELGGSGSIGGPVSIASGGTLSPGNSIASLATGTTTFAAAATFAYEVDSTNLNALGTAADLLVVTGNLSLDPGNGTLLTFTDLNLTPQPFVQDSTIFALINYTGSWNGGLFSYGGAVLPDGGRFTVGSQQWEIDYNRTSTTDLANFTTDYLPTSSFVAITAVPEPSTYAMALAGLAYGGYSLFRRRKRA